jgi:hypothetical protein
MRTLFVCACLVAFTQVTAVAIETGYVDVAKLKVISDGNGYFISTNVNSIGFYLMVHETDWESMVGKKLDRNYIKASKTITSTQFTQGARSGQLRFTNYHIADGRFACIKNNVLTLTDFTIELSAEKDSYDYVVSVHRDSISCLVSDKFVAEATERKIDK